MVKDKYGDVEDIESSDSESEDDVSDALDPDLEEDWLKTLIAIRNKDPRIYKKDETFYREKIEREAGEKSKSKKPAKPVYLKDIERKVMLERDGKYEDDSSAEEGPPPSQHQPSYVEEQRQLQKSFVDAAFKASDDDEEPGSDDADGGLFTKKVTSTSDKVDEEKSYDEWKKSQPVVQDRPAQEEARASTSSDTLWNGITSNESEKYLRNYIQNKQYLATSKQSFPSYEDIIAEDLSEDEEAVEQQEDFERKYNFRYEEPDPEFIKSYPRTMANSVRRKDTSRVDKRNEIRDRKQLEKEKKKSEIRQLKNLKKQEIESKLDQLRLLVGDSESFRDIDIDGDFDPAEHDRIMENMFADNYYSKEVQNGEKPVFDDDDEIDWDKWDGEKDETPEDGNDPEADGNDPEAENDPEQGTGDSAATTTTAANDDEGHANTDEQQDFNMDADFDPNIAPPRLPKGKRGRRKSRFERAIMKKKPVFEPSEKTFEQYFDEYYKLDCEDIIEDMPCRFKYRSVMANDFGLSTDEIINAKDKELNSWVSIKKMSQYRSEELEVEEKETYKRKGYNQRKKMSMFPSLQEVEPVQCSSRMIDSTPVEKVIDSTPAGKKTTFSEEPMPSVENEVKVDESSSPPRKKMKTTTTAKVVKEKMETKVETIKKTTPKKIKETVTKEIKDTVTKEIKDTVTKEEKTVKETASKDEEKEQSPITSEQNAKTSEVVSTDATVKSDAEPKSPALSKAKPTDTAVDAKKKQVQNNNNKNKNNNSNVNKNNNKNKKNNKNGGDAKNKSFKKKKKPDIISDERLKSFGINPKKYKYEILKDKHDKLKKNK